VRGVNWTSSLELALRLVNWSFAWHMLGGEPATMVNGDASIGVPNRIRTGVTAVKGKLSVQGCTGL
jgi:hypothetical protein